MGLDAAELIHQVFRDHQEIRDTFQAPGQLVRIQLINGIEGLILNPGMAVQLIEGHDLMHFGNGRLRAAVTIGIAGEYLLITAHQHIVNAPGIHGKGGKVRITGQRRVNALPDITEQRVNIPGQVPVLLRDAVGKTEDLLCPDFPVFLPADNVTAAGRTDINGEMLFQNRVTSCTDYWIHI